MKGQLLAEKYRLVKELGRGGMGSVWLASHEELRAPVAIKLIDSALVSSREARSRFLREARAASALRSNHVVQVFDYGVHLDTPFLVMEYLEGENLATRLERRKALSLAELQTLIRQVARALTKAHAAGIVHRDLKPENIYIVSEADSELVKVLDFGIAKVEASMAVSVQTQTGMVLGTPFYMSPEQAEGRRELDARSDIWSLGVIAYECLLGRRPFHGETLAQIILAICADPLPVPSAAGEVPAGFDEWFARTNERRVEFRYQSVGEMVDALLTLGSATGEQERVPLLGASPASSPRTSALMPDGQAKQDEWPEQAPDPEGAVHTSAEGKEPGLGDAQTQIPLHSPLSPVLWSAACIVAVVAGVLLWRSTVSVTGAVGEQEQMGSAQVSAHPEAPDVDRPMSEPMPALPSLHAPVPSRRVTSTEPRAIRSEPSLSLTSPSFTSKGETKSIAPPVGAGASAPAKAPLSPSASQAKQIYCTEHALSGRLLKASPGASGSFPCYVHSRSGQLRRKN